MFCLPAPAQTLDDNDANLLRGRVNENDINRELTNPDNGNRRTEQEQPSNPAAIAPYEPISTSDGSPELGPQPTDLSIFNDTENGELQSEQFQRKQTFNEMPIPSGRPKSAGQRSKERSDQLAAGPESAADRRKREEDERRKAQGVNEDQQTPVVRTGTVDSQIDRRLDPGAERVEAIEGQDREPDENPYEAVGIAAGNFILRPSIEQGVTITDNINSSPEGSDAVLSETTLRLNAISESEGDRTVLNGYGIYRESVSGEDYDYAEGGFDGEIERQIGDDYKAKGTIAYAIRPESFASPVEVAGAASQPIQQTLDASVGISKDLGKALLGLTANIEREWYGDADVESAGVRSTVSQEDRNSTLATVGLRAGYEISPAITPFVEVEAGRRFYDIEQNIGAGVDPLDRSANHLAANAGVELDFGEKLNGELSAGYVMENPEDERLGTIGGLNMAAKLNWSPERGTVVALTGSTVVEGTTDSNSTGSLLHSGRLSVERQIRANLTANVGVGIAYREYQGTGNDDLIYSAEAGATWWLNRYTGLTARARHETLDSSIEGRDTKTNSVFLGLRLQR